MQSKSVGMLATITRSVDAFPLGACL